MVLVAIVVLVIVLSGGKKTTTSQVVIPTPSSTTPTISPGPSDVPGITGGTSPTRPATTTATTTTTTTTPVFAPATVSIVHGGGLNPYDKFQNFNSNELVSFWFQGGGGAQKIVGVVDSPSGGSITWASAGNPFYSDSDCSGDQVDPQNLHFTCANAGKEHGANPMALVTGESTIWRITLAGVDPNNKVGPPIALCGHGSSFDTCPGPAKL